ncbi:MAG: EthD family reductase [Terracidiphilus sp.]
MIKVSVLYPSKPGSRFDVDYYLTVHMPMATRLLGAAVKDTSIEIGIGGGAPNEPAPYAAIVGFTCDSVDAFMAAFTPVVGQLQGDFPNYTDIQPVIQISEIRRIS